MIINKLHINRKACALVCAGVIAVAGLTGCSSVDKDTKRYFDDVDDAEPKNYYSIVEEGHRYFVNKTELLNKLPHDELIYPVGLSVNEKGDTVIHDSHHITDDDVVVDCIVTYDSKMDDGSKYAVSFVDADDAEKVEGFRIKKDGVTYDVSREDVIQVIYDSSMIPISGLNGDYHVGSNIEFESNTTGGRDIVKVKK